MNEFPANLLMALAWFFRSFERQDQKRAEALALKPSCAPRLLNLVVGLSPSLSIESIQ